MTDGSGKAPRRRSWEPLPNRSTEPTSVRAALDQLASTMGMASVDGINRLFMNWAEIVGEEVATHCTPTQLRDGVLVIRAEDAQWASELSWMTDLIAARCNEALDVASVDEVRVRR